MILLDDVVQVLALPQPAASSDYAFLFELIGGDEILRSDRRSCLPALGSIRLAAG
jgi:hypothetical protein